jgi:dCMP deaminase
MNLDEYFMNIAKAVALRSNNQSTKVGCVIVSENNKIISTGYNDFPSSANLKYMTNEKPMFYLLDVHAEMMALIDAKSSVAGAKVYVTIASCENCFKHLIVAGIREVIYEKLFTTNKSTGTPERLEAVIRLMKATKTIHRNMEGKSFIDDVKDNGVTINV